MSQVEIISRPREVTSKGIANRLRKDGWVPGVVYGHGKEARHVAVDKRILERVLESGAHIVNLKDEESSEVTMTILKEVQEITWQQEILHVDFQEVDPNERVHVTVQIALKGDAIGVKNGGSLDFTMHEIELECPVSSIIDKLTIDISGLDRGKAIHVSELDLAEGTKPMIDGNLVVVAIRDPRAEEDEDSTGADTEVQAQPEVISETKRDERAQERDK